jgi:hypothetical protein
LSLAAFESGNLTEARETIQRQPRLANATTGHELLARLALQDGKLAEAERLYQAIANDSAEAQAFLARRAFERQDWQAARLQTEKLQRLMPDALQLRENLLAIAKAENQP